MPCSKGESYLDGNVRSIVGKIGKENKQMLKSNVITTMTANDYTLYGQNNGKNSWCTGDRYGTQFNVADEDGRMLYYTGTLNDGVISKAPCDLRSLPAGKYEWRVTGNLSPNRDQVSYDFCGMHGYHSTEIQFEIDSDGTCNPLFIKDLNDICDEKEEYSKRGYFEKISAISLEGTIHMEGIRNSELTPSELDIIRTSLSQEFLETDSVTGSEVRISTLPIITDNSPDAHTNVKMNTIQLHFEATVWSNYTTITNRNNNNNNNNNNMNGYNKSKSMSSISAKESILADDFAGYLYHSMKSGLFKAKLMKGYNNNSYNNNNNSLNSTLQTIGLIRLENLSIIDKFQSTSTLQVNIANNFIIIIFACISLIGIMYIYIKISGK